MRAAVRNDGRISSTLCPLLRVQEACLYEKMENGGRVEMKDLQFSEILRMQHELWEKHAHEWSPLEPKYARNSLLWMLGEIGEVIEIIKKCEEEKIEADADIKRAFTEELCDVLMYFGDVLLRYEITAEMLAEAYVRKHNKNMQRSFAADEKVFEEGLKK